MKIVLVCGGRDYDDVDLITIVLDNLRIEFGTLFIVQGGAKGADLLARKYAIANGLPCATVHANWGFYGPTAGPIRNGWMLGLNIDVVIAFFGGRGTADMVRRAKSAGIEVREITDEAVRQHSPI
jgi:hypothetical protein